jgi:hypothetical protein
MAFSTTFRRTALFDTYFVFMKLLTFSSKLAITFLIMLAHLSPYFATFSEIMLQFLRVGALMADNLLSMSTQSTDMDV